MMMVKCLLELPEKNVVGNLELVYDGFGIGGENATGDGGRLRPSVDRERSFEKGLSFKWSQSATRRCVGGSAMRQRKGCNEPGRRSGAEFLFRAELVKTCKIEVTGVSEMTEVFSPEVVIL